MCSLQVPLYAINQHLVFEKIKALDIGGSISIHAFGAYYGLAATMFVSKAGTGAEHPKNAATYTSDITATIGTLFLWIFWPSFNAALGSNPGSENQVMHRLGSRAVDCERAWGASLCDSNPLTALLCSRHPFI